MAFADTLNVRENEREAVRPVVEIFFRAGRMPLSGARLVTFRLFTKTNTTRHDAIIEP